MSSVSTAKKPRTTAAQRGLTVAEVAERLAVSDDHILTLISRGTLPGVRVPGIGQRAARIVVLQDDLQRCIEEWKARP